MGRQSRRPIPIRQQAGGRTARTSGGPGRAANPSKRGSPRWHAPRSEGRRPTLSRKGAQMNIGQVLVGAGAAAFPAASAGAAAAGRLAAATIGHGATSRSRAAGTVTIAAGGAPGGATQTAAQRQAEELGALLTRLVRGAVTGTSTSATSGPSGTSGSRAFLKDSRLSVEEKLARLMAQLSDKYEKQLEQKLQQFGDLDAGKTGSSSSTKKSSSTSALSSLGSGLTSLLS